MVDIVSRAQWGARPPADPGKVIYVSWSKRIGVAVHYSLSSPTATPRDLQNYAMNELGYNDTHYNFFVDTKGVAYEGRGWLVVAAHAANQNTPWIGVCFIGRNEDVTNAAKNTIRALYDEANRLSGRTLQYSGHGQLPGQSTSCPGDNLRAWVAAGMPYVDANGEDDMFCVYGDNNQKVAAMQFALLRQDRNCLPLYGPNGQYGDETAAAVMKYVTGAGDPNQGRVYIGQQFEQLQWNNMVKAAQDAVAGAEFQPGPPGPAGTDGADGVDGRTPTKVLIAGTLSAEVIEYAED